MTTPRAIRAAVAAGATMAFLAGCGSHSLLGTPDAAHYAARTKNKEFHYKPAQQNFRVPSGVTQLVVVVSGPSGADSTGRYGHARGGLGGKVTATIPVALGETLAIFVGGEGREGQTKFAGRGGFNGGGDGGIPAGDSSTGGDGGGGASDIREGGNTLGNRIVIAGGGETGGKGKRNGNRDDAGG